MKLLTALFIALALAACSAGSGTDASDMKAVYSGADGGFRMTLEISDTGDLRGETQGQDMWLLRTGDVNYFILPNPEDGDIVLDSRIMGELIREALPPEFFEMMQENPNTGIEMEPIGEVTVNGRTGTGYHPPGTQGDNVPFVFSDDPELSRLRDAMAAQFEASMSMMPIENRMFSQMLELLQEGAPLRFANTDLVSFEPADIDNSRFELPGEPLDKDAARTVMINMGMIPAEPMEMPEFPQAAE